MLRATLRSPALRATAPTIPDGWQPQSGTQLSESAKAGGSSPPAFLPQRPSGLPQVAQNRQSSASTFEPQ